MLFYVSYCISRTPAMTLWQLFSFRHKSKEILNLVSSLKSDTEIKHF